MTGSRWIPDRRNLSKERQTEFFTAVNPMNKEYKDPYKLDLTAQRSNAIIFYDTPQLIVSRKLLWSILEKLPARSKCITLATCDDFFQRLLDGSIGFRSCCSYRILLKSKTQLSRTERLVLPEQHWVRVFRKSKKFLTWLLKHECKNGEICSPIVCQCLLNALIKTHRRRTRKTQIMLERGDPLKVNNPSICSHSARTWTFTSECLDCHMQL